MLDNAAATGVQEGSSLSCPRSAAAHQTHVATAQWLATLTFAGLPAPRCRVQLLLQPGEKVDSASNSSHGSDQPQHGIQDRTAAGVPHLHCHLPLGCGAHGPSSRGRMANPGWKQR